MSDDNSLKEIRGEFVNAYSDAVKNNEVLGKNQKVELFERAEQLCINKFPELEVEYWFIFLNHLEMHFI